jgi:glycosyltransferase involved in cell wall biosynthesis
MRIAHVAPPLARRGGPAGYLLQLANACARETPANHSLTFPRPAAPSTAAPRPLAVRARARLGRVKRMIAGPPVYFRPAEGDIRRENGAIDALLTTSMQNVLVEDAESLAAAAASGADVLFAHEPAAAERLLDQRRAGQQVWLMMHAPMPIGLDMAWSWGVPEWEWQALAALPDTRRWVQWELDICARVDRRITACPEAVDELSRVDGRFGALSFDYILTGAAGPARVFPNETRAQLRRRWRLPADVPVGLFLGTALPYRGLDVLMDAAATLPRSVPGIVAVAGPHVDKVRSHPRLRALGSIPEVSDLLDAVDFTINVNRFSLFDLSTIEAAQAGRPMLLHATGGNRRFAQLGVGAVLIDDVAPETIARGLRDLFAMPESRRAELAHASRACYDAYLQPSHLLARHLALYDRAVIDAAVLAK